MLKRLQTTYVLIISVDFAAGNKIIVSYITENNRWSADIYN